MPTDWLHFGESLKYGQLFFRIALAVIMGAAIGIEREIKNRPAGMRTHVLVCLGAALVALVEQEMVASVAALANSQINVSVGRLTAGVVSGVGFLGAGTIVMAEKKITGLTTAASLWCTACIGIAIGAGYTTMAILSGIMVLVILCLMQRIVHVNTYKKLEVQFVHRQETIAFLNEYFEQMHIEVMDTDFHAETRKEGNLYTNVYTLSLPTNSSFVTVIAELSERPNIRAVRTRNV